MRVKTSKFYYMPGMILSAFAKLIGLAFSEPHKGSTISGGWHWGVHAYNRTCRFKCCSP
jgi:hypothetical protein